MEEYILFWVVVFLATWKVMEIGAGLQAYFYRKFKDNSKEPF